MLLKNLINNLSPNVGKLKIRGLSLDSRNVKKGDLFISIKGNKFNANNYIEEAISKGAKAVIYSGSVKKKYGFVSTNSSRSNQRHYMYKQPSF